MSAIVEAVLTDSSFETRELSYAALQRSTAARYCTLYDRLRIENPTWRSAQLCGTLGISPQRLNKYRHLLGATKRVTKQTTAQKQAAQEKGMLTRSRNDARKRYLAELRERNLEFPEIKRLIEEWEREHEMPDMAPAGAARLARTASPSRAAPLPSAEDAANSEGRKSKRRGGRVPEEAPSLAFSEQQSDGESTGRLRGVSQEALAKADAAMLLLNERK